MASAPHGPPEGFRRRAARLRTKRPARLAAGEPFAWRLSLEAARGAAGTARPSRRPARGRRASAGPSSVDARAAGDVVLARKDVGVAYHLAVVVDDARQGVTEVIRGQDLFEADPRPARCCRPCSACRAPATATTA